MCISCRLYVDLKHKNGEEDTLEVMHRISRYFDFDSLHLPRENKNRDITRLSITQKRKKMTDSIHILADQ
jgi:hypothetical protein